MAKSAEAIKVNVVKMPKAMGMDSVSPVNKEEERPVTAEFSFREKGKVQPAGYEGLGIDDDATVTVKGKVKSLGSTWDKGPRFTIEISSCDISVPAEKSASLSAAIEAADKTRKKVK